MTVTRQEIEEVAGLAALSVDPDEAETLAEQIRRILDYVGQLDAVQDEAEPFRPGPVAAPLRDDVVEPMALHRPPDEFAPEFIDGLFVVPRLPEVGEEP